MQIIGPAGLRAPIAPDVAGTYAFMVALDGESIADQVGLAGFASGQPAERFDCKAARNSRAIARFA